MGRATRWLKGLFGIKRSDSNSNTNPLPKSSPDKRRWRFVKSFREKPSSSRHLTRQSSRFGAAQSLSSTTQAKVDPASYYADDPTKHAISVAAASAAAAEAAVVSAKAAAAVVRLTTSSGREPWAALMIQSHFRGYLARRALRALKGLVRLQALVRGHIMRKKAAETMKCMQAMLRAQARARAVRVHLPDSPYSSGKSSQTSHRGPPTPEKFEQGFYVKNATRDHSPVFRRSSSRLSSRGQDQGYFSSSSSDPRIDEPTWDLPRRDKILKVDPAGKSNLTPPKRRKSLFESSSQHSGLASDQISHTYTHSYTYTTSKDSTACHGAMITTPSVDVQLPIFNPLKLSSHDKVNDVDDEEGTFCTAQNSPHFHCASPVLGGGSSLSRRGTAEYTPTKSDESFSGLSFYSDCPSYMACTESSRAKIRSLSTPRQRPPSYERSSSTKRWSVHHHGHGDSRSSSQRASTGSSVHSSYSSKAYYPGSGRLDRLGMPVRNSCGVYYSGYLN